MKVMHMLPSLASGGVEQVVVELCQGLCPRGVETIVVSGGGPLAAAVEAAGARHITLPIGRKSLRTFLMVPRVAHLIRAERPDVLHLHSRVPAWVGHLAARRVERGLRPLVVTSFHGFHSVNFYSGIMARGDRVIAVSECMKRHILENYPATPEERITVVPNSVDTALNFPGYRPPAEWWGRWRHDFPELEGKYTLCLPGRITRIKGAAHLIPLLADLRGRGIPAHAVIAGETKKGKEALRRELENAFAIAGLQDCVTWTGYRSDLRDVLCACDATLSLTTIPESFGKTVLDALALGRPVAGYEHGGVGELLDVFLPQGKVPVGDTAAMADLLASWRNRAPAPKTPVPPPFRREDMMEGHLRVYRGR